MITVNKNTTQNPLSTTGRTGKQSTRYIPAPRVYIGPPDYSNPANVVLGLSNGVSPMSFLDLGIVDGSVSVSLNRTTQPVYAGVDKLLVGEYLQGTKATISFTLAQADDFVLESVSGISPHAYVTNSYSRYLMGGQDLTAASLLLVVQNKLDGKEIQLYNPAALLSFSYEMASDAMVLKVVGILPAFSSVSGGSNQILSMTILASQIPGYGLYGYGLSYGA